MSDNFWKNSLIKVWDGFLNNIVVCIFTFICSVGSLFIIKIQKIQIWVRSIPTDYVLIPFVLTLLLVFILIRIIYKQKKHILKFETFNFISHHGVWWNIDSKYEFIEDFPYCSCCDHKMKLIETEKYPTEKFICPETKNQYELPANRSDIVSDLYEMYFENFPPQFSRYFFSEIDRIQRLSLDISNEKLMNNLFKMKPLCRIPRKEKRKIFAKFNNPASAFNFVDSHYNFYKKFFKKKK